MIVGKPGNPYDGDTAVVRFERMAVGPSGVVSAAVFHAAASCVFVRTNSNDSPEGAKPSKARCEHNAVIGFCPVMPVTGPDFR